jgi:hypothetical protein
VPGRGCPDACEAARPHQPTASGAAPYGAAGITDPRGPEHVDDVDYSYAPAKSLEEGLADNAGLDRAAQCLVTLSCTDVECVREPETPVMVSV